MTKTSTLNLPVFYTCTAATPDGPPLEIAWGLLAFETYGVMCGSHLARPPAAWISPSTPPAILSLPVPGEQPTSRR